MNTEINPKITKGMSVCENAFRYWVVMKHNIKAFRCMAYRDRAIERLDA